MEVARGMLGDRPWGATLATLQRRTHTGALTLVPADGGAVPFVIEVEDGIIIAAHSPVAADSAPRIAAALDLVADPAALATRIAATPGTESRDEVEVVAELESLTGRQTSELRSAMLVRRVARTFATAGGTFIITNDPPRGRVVGAGVPIPHAIYQGVLTRMSDKRLAEDIAMFPARFALEADIDGNAYGFGNGELQPLLLALRANSSLQELEVRFVTLGIRRVQAAVYTLLSCGVCVPIEAPLVETTPVSNPELARTNTLRVSVRQSTAPPFADSTQVAAARTASGERAPTLARTLSGSQPNITRSSSPDLATRGSSPDLARAAKPPTAPPATLTPRPPTTPPATTAAGTAPGPVTARAPTGNDFEFAAGSSAIVDRTPTPNLDKTPSRGGPRTLTPSAVLARTLTPRPGGTMPPPEVTAAAAAESFDAGSRAITNASYAEAVTQLSRAVALAPGKLDYAATLAWAKFLGAPDKPEAAPEARRMLGVIAQRETLPKLARFFLGRVERIVGREREALGHFREVLSAQPSHTDALAEIRAIEAEIQRRTPQRR